MQGANKRQFISNELHRPQSHKAKNKQFYLTFEARLRRLEKRVGYCSRWRGGARPRKLRATTQFHAASGNTESKKTLNKIVKFQLQRRYCGDSCCLNVALLPTKVDVSLSPFKFIIFFSRTSFCFSLCRWNIVEERVGYGQSERVFLSTMHLGIRLQRWAAVVHWHHVWTGKPR